MESLSKEAVAFNGLVDGLSGVIHAWRPAALPSERAYRDTLANFLRDTIPEDCRVECEYRHEGTTSDIYVAWSGIMLNDEVFLELKRSLTRKSEYDRLIGQIEGLRPGTNKIIVVLCGGAAPVLTSRLRSHYADLIDDIDPAMAIVTVP